MVQSAKKWALVAATLKAPIATGKALSFDYALSKYIANTKVNDRLAQYFRNQTPENEKILRNTFKQEFGKSIEEVTEEMQRHARKLGITAIHALPEEDKDEM